MDNKEKVLAIIVAFVVVDVALIGAAVVVHAQRTAPTLAQNMMLRPSDLGPDWEAVEGSPIQDHQGQSSWDGSGFIRQSTEHWMGIEIDIYVFNTTGTCESVYLNNIADIEQNPKLNCTNVSLGDGGIAFSIYVNPYQYGYPNIVFHERNVLCYVVVPVGAIQPTTAPKSWWQGTLMYFAILQLERIDSYLGV